MRRLLGAFYDGSNRFEFLLAVAVLLIALALGVYKLDAGTISTTKASLISATINQYPALVEILKSDRDQVYRAFTYQMPKDQKLEEFLALQNLDIGNDTWIVSGDGTDTYRVRDKVPRLVRKQILGSLFGDEPNTLAAIGRFKPKQLNFNPKWFFYGGSYLYPVAAFVGVATIARHGFKALSLDATLRDPLISRTMYVSARFFGVLSGLAAVILLGMIASQLFGPRAGCYAVILTATTPFLVMFGHLSKPYNTASMWAFASVYATLQYLSMRKKSHFFISAIFAGLAVGANYVFVYFSFLMVVARITLLISDKKRSSVASPLKSFAGDIALYGAVVAAAFLASNPYWLFNLDIVRSEITMADPSNLTHFGRIKPLQADLVTVTRGILATLRYALDYPLLILGIASFPMLARKLFLKALPKTAECLMIFFWGAPFIFGAAFYNTVFLQQSLHYMTAFCLLFFTLLSAAVFVPLFKRFRLAGILILLIAGGYNSIHSWRHVASLADFDNRNAEFGKLITATVPEGASITTMIAVSDAADSFTLNILHAPQLMTTVILPDFNFFAYKWRFRNQITASPSPDDAEYILDTMGDAGDEISDTFSARYTLVAVSPRRYFVPGSLAEMIFPRLITTSYYKDILLWRKKPLTPAPA